MEYLQTFYLAILQGITEFLPISSSGHLILMPALMGWKDQGLVFDVAVHVGTLIAVVIYFWSDLKQIVWDCIRVLGGAQETQYSRLGWMVALASLMIAPIGMLLDSWIEGNLRSATAVAIATMLFGLFLGLADLTGKKERDIHSLEWKDAIVIGLSQILALIPGTSRSGITITAGLMLGLSREAASRFSFLLAIPVIMFAGLWEARKLAVEEAAVNLGPLIFAVLVSAIVAYLCIHWFLRFVNRIGMIPFVIYRVFLGAFLFWYFVL